MDTKQNSKEIIYNMKNIKSCFNKATKIFPKRKSDDITGKSNLLLLIKNTTSNVETSSGSENKTTAKKKLFPETDINFPKQKKICIKFADLVAEEKIGDEDSDKHLELALQIKKRKYTNNSKIKITKCDQIFLDNNKEKEKEKEDKKNKKELKKKSSKSMNKVILGNQNEENIIIKKIKKKLLCC